MEINERILEIIKFYQLEQQQFAERVGVTPASISKIVKGLAVPGGKVLMEILFKFPEVSAEWLMRGRGYMLIKNSSVQSPEINWSQYRELKAEIEVLRKEIEGLKKRNQN